MINQKKTADQSEEVTEIRPMPIKASIDEAPAKEIVDNLTTPLSVELGRVMLSIPEIASLQSGKIIELAKQPGDAVDLVVGNKSIGKGELVNIEGELGVRVLSLVK